MITPSDPSEEIDPVDLKDEVEETKSSLSSESNPEIDDESPENQPSPSTSDDQKGNSKKFECDQCDFTCLTHGGLYLHQKAVHLGIRFKCDQCDYEGTQEINLKRHIESKHGTIQYCCKLCSAKTRGLWYIETHLKKIHGITNKADNFKYLTLKRVDPHKGSDKSSLSEVTEMTDEVNPTEMLDQHEGLIFTQHAGTKNWAQCSGEKRERKKKGNVFHPRENVGGANLVFVACPELCRQVFAGEGK